MKLSAVLLAGGESRRMGQDKATMIFNGQPLWRHQIELLRNLSPLEILISARTDPSWRPSGTVFVADSAPSRGPLSGLTAAMARMQGTHLLAMAIDMPLMTSSHLRAMARLVTSIRGVIPIIGTRAEPLAAIYSRETLPYLSDSFESGDFSLQYATASLVRLGLLAVMSVRDQDVQLYRNFNAPADMARFEAAEI